MLQDGPDVARPCRVIITSLYGDAYIPDSLGASDLLKFAVARYCVTELDSFEDVPTSSKRISADLCDFFHPVSGLDLTGSNILDVWLVANSCRTTRHELVS